MKNLIFGIGINNSTYKTGPLISGKKATCPYYARWKSMIQRCYSQEYISRNPTYTEVFVCDEWLNFMNFRSWMQKQDWHGKYLDKDIICPGNKIYSPETCAFVDIETNNLIITRRADRGEYPLGVVRTNKTSKFTAVISMGGSDIRIGIYETPKLASNAYLKVKNAYIMDSISKQTDYRVIIGLKLHANRYLNGEVK